MYRHASGALVFGAGTIQWSWGLDSNHDFASDAPSLAMHANLSKVISEDVLAELTRREAFGRSAETWEVANVIVFLASDYSSYMTGEVVSVSSQHP